MNEYADPHLEFQEPGRVQLRAHYKYSLRADRSPDRFGMMLGVAPFELVSDPVEFEVRRSLDVQVKVKRAMKANVKQRLSELLEVVVLNRTASPQTLAGPRGNPDATLQLQLQAQQQLVQLLLFFLGHMQLQKVPTKINLNFYNKMSICLFRLWAFCSFN